MGDVIVNLTLPLLIVRHGSMRALPHFILTTTRKKRYYCFLHFSDEGLGYREVKSFIQCSITN